MLLHDCETDVGFHPEKQVNQDRIIARKVRLNGSDISILGIADGFGQNGQFASAKVSDVLENITVNTDDLLQTRNECLKAVKAACRQINNEIGINPKQEDIFGATLTLAVIADRSVFCLHIGDTRLYHIRKNRIKQKTIDHNLAGARFRNGEISQEALLTHEDRKSLYYYLGGGENYISQIDEFSFEINPGDYLFFSSDGFHDGVPMSSWCRPFEKTMAPGPIIKALMQMAKAAEPKDNISIMVVKFQ